MTTETTIYTGTTRRAIGPYRFRDGLPITIVATDTSHRIYVNGTFIAGYATAAVAIAKAERF